jgi:hypothetical protein
MKTKLLRATVFAATRMVRDGFPATDHRQAIREAYISLFDREIDESTDKGRKRLEDASSLLNDLGMFAIEVKGNSHA